MGAEVIVKLPIDHFVFSGEEGASNIIGKDDVLAHAKSINSWWHGGIGVVGELSGPNGMHL